MTPAELIRAVGNALYGPRWQCELARALRMGDRTVRQWLSGGYKPRRETWPKLIVLLNDRKIELDKTIEIIDLYVTETGEWKLDSQRKAGGQNAQNLQDFQT